MKRRIVDLTIMLICTSIFIWCAFPYINQREKSNENTVNGQLEIDGEQKVNTDADLIIWYTDSNIQDYIKESAYMYSTGMNIEYVQVSALDYLENINKLNLSGEGMPDLYILDSEMLEKAYLAGLTLENNDKNYNKDNYPQVALRAATYQNKLIAYPFYFDTSFLVYNKKYVDKAPETFDDILTFAQSFDASSVGVENILKWDVKSILYNYGFLGAYLDFGGENGDDSSAVNLNKEQLFNCLSYYNSLYQYFSIDLNTINYDTVVDEFINGKTVFSILSAKSIEKLNKSGIDYGIADFPDLTLELKSKNLSATKVVVVNPYSKNVEKAEELAKYLTYDNAENIYELTDYMASRQLDSYDVYGLNEVMQQYEQTTNLPKLMSARDFWVQLQNIMNNIWVGADINTELTNLENKINSYSNSN